MNSGETTGLWTAVSLVLSASEDLIKIINFHRNCYCSIFFSSPRGELCKALDDISTSGQLRDWGGLVERGDKWQTAKKLTVFSAWGKWWDPGERMIYSASTRSTLPGSLLSKRALCLAAITDSKQLLIAAVGSARPSKFVHDSSTKCSLHSYSLYVCSWGSVQGGFVPPLA